MRRFNGRTLEDALHAVTLALGTDARIIKADTVRMGGVGGFFSREHVELLVETDTATPTPVAPKSNKRITPKKAVAAPRGFDFTSATDKVATPSAPSSSEVAPTIAAPATTSASAAETATPKSILDLVNDTNDQDEVFVSSALAAEPKSLEDNPDDNDLGDLPILTSHPTISDSESFAAVLDRIAQQTGQLPSNVTAPVTADQLPKYTVELLAPPASTPSVEPAITAPDSSDDSSPSETPSHSNLMLDARVTHEAFRAADPLRALGIPDSFLPREAALGDIYNRLMSSLKDLPRPAALPSGDGSVIAVAGWRKGALATAHELAIRLGLDPNEIVLASSNSDKFATAHERLITSAAQADEMRRSWRWRDHPTIVAVDAALGTRENLWAANVLRGLAPNSAWGVVDATRKPEDVAEWNTMLGGLDAFCLVGAETTRTPAAILDLGVPIALLDGHPATSERWANLLTSRLAA